MENGKIYVVKIYSYLTKQTELLETAYLNKDSAKEYCLSKLNVEEIEKNNKLYKRGLITEFEFVSKNYCYTIGELDIKI